MITPPDPHEAELADEAKTADDAPAPVHPPAEREQIVRDAHGKDPYGGDHFGPDGERVVAELGVAPDQLPDPAAAELRQLGERDDHQ